MCLANDHLVPLAPHAVLLLVVGLVHLSGIICMFSSNLDNAALNGPGVAAPGPALGGALAQVSSGLLTAAEVAVHPLLTAILQCVSFAVNIWDPVSAAAAAVTTPTLAYVREPLMYVLVLALAPAMIICILLWRASGAAHSAFSLVHQAALKPRRFAAAAMSLGARARTSAAPESSLANPQSSASAPGRELLGAAEEKKIKITTRAPHASDAPPTAPSLPQRPVHAGAPGEGEADMGERASGQAPGHYVYTRGAFLPPIPFGS